MLHIDDYMNTRVVYHVAPIVQLKYILNNGLKSGGENSNYDEFNEFFDRFRPRNIPEWVLRKSAIYASMGFRKNHQWHSHSVLLSFKVDEDLCWIGNENLANQLFEPFILKDLFMFKDAEKLIKCRGEHYANKYWEHSLSFKDNLQVRMDKVQDYDAEVLVMHDVPPCDINVVKIISDHKFLDIDEWNLLFSELNKA